MKASLDKRKGKMFGIRRRNMPATIVIFHNRTIAAHDDAYRIEKAVLEAEHKKAQALTVTRRINFFP